MIELRTTRPRAAQQGVHWTWDEMAARGLRITGQLLRQSWCRHPDVAECAVFGMIDDLKGQVPRGLVILNTGVERPDRDIERKVVDLVRQEIGLFAVFKRAHIGQCLPKTQSGKIF